MRDIQRQMYGEHPGPVLLLSGVREPSEPRGDNLLGNHLPVNDVLIHVCQCISACNIPVSGLHSAYAALVEQERFGPAVEPYLPSEFPEFVLKGNGQLM